MVKPRAVTSATAPLSRPSPNCAPRASSVPVVLTASIMLKRASVAEVSRSGSVVTAKEFALIEGASARFSSVPPIPLGCGYRSIMTGAWTATSPPLNRSAAASKAPPGARCSSVGCDGELMTKSALNNTLVSSNSSPSHRDGLDAAGRPRATTSAGERQNNPRTARTKVCSAN